MVLEEIALPSSDPDARSQGCIVLQPWTIAWTVNTYQNKSEYDTTTNGSRPLMFLALR